MDTTLDPKQTDPRHVLLARADEELAHAYDQITRANEEIARAEKQLSKLEQDRMPSRATDHCLTGRRYAASLACCCPRASVSLPSLGSRPTAMRPKRLSRGGRLSKSMRRFGDIARIKSCK